MRRAQRLTRLLLLRRRRPTLCRVMRTTKGGLFSSRMLASSSIRTSSTLSVTMIISLHGPSSCTAARHHAASSLQNVVRSVAI